MRLNTKTAAATASSESSIHTRMLSAEKERKGIAIYFRFIARSMIYCSARDLIGKSFSQTFYSLSILNAHLIVSIKKKLTHISELRHSLLHFKGNSNILEFFPFLPLPIFALSRTKFLS